MSHHSSFETTQWSVVLSAGHSEPERARTAIEQLCRRYWFPLYAFIRRRGHDEPESEDLVQAFFVRILEKDVFAAADRDRGKFRTFLLSSLENFLSNERAKGNALRRGGGVKRLSLDRCDKDGNTLQLIADDCSPEDEFHRQWAIAVLAQTLEVVESEYRQTGKAALFNALSPYLSADSQQKPYAVVAESLKMSESNVKVAVHRLRRRYRKQLELEIAATVESPSQVDEEIRQLFQMLTPS
ncbi:MAG: sigma-70 family RNA polymerase sigma factor [Planctomycetales bacterium]|nr:sigma-70 family RNA polymerase sigma factor [Planctomycetales bacterium]